MQQSGYYRVRIRAHNHEAIHTVFATSDYAAAVNVRKKTGIMAINESDVSYIPVIASRTCHAPA